MGRKGQLKLGAFLMNTGHHIASWRHPDAVPQQVLQPDYFKNIAKTAERGKFDMVFLADTLALQYRNSPSANHQLFGRLDPLILLSTLAAVTDKIGLAATVSTTYNEPYHVARAFASLDHISKGRAAWNVVTSGSEAEAHNFGQEKHLDHALRYKRAEEFVEVATKLWDSWEDEALIRDKALGTYADANKVHYINHSGDLFKVRGPLNVPRTPQGRPVVIQAGSSEAGQDLAALTAEVIFTAQQTLAEAQAFYANVKGLMVKQGRSPNDLKIMPGISPILGASEQEAQEKEAQLQELVLPGVGLTLLSNLLNHDLSVYPLDGPLPKLAELAQINGNKSRFKLVADLALNEGLSIREIGRRVAGARGHKTFVGTPLQLADLLEQWFLEEGCDGFNIMPPFLPGGLTEFVDLVIPELQRRGIFRTEYTGATLREHLELPTAINQFNRVVS